MGSINVFPLGMVLGNCVAWASYSLLISNPYIFWSNAPGVLIGLFMISSGLMYGSDTQRSLLETMLLIMATIFLGVGFCVSMVLLAAEDKQNLMVLVANGFVMVFYSAPLSTLGNVLSTRSAASINGSMSLASLLNSALWTAYGSAIGNPGVYCPNAIGVVLSIVQLGLIAAFGSGKNDAL